MEVWVISNFVFCVKFRGDVACVCRENSHIATGVIVERDCGSSMHFLTHFIFNSDTVSAFVIDHIGAAHVPAFYARYLKLRFTILLLLLSSRCFYQTICIIGLLRRVTKVTFKCYPVFENVPWPSNPQPDVYYGLDICQGIKRGSSTLTHSYHVRWPRGEFWTIFNNFLSNFWLTNFQGQSCKYLLGASKHHLIMYINVNLHTIIIWKLKFDPLNALYTYHNTDV